MIGLQYLVLATASNNASVNTVHCVFLSQFRHCEKLCSCRSNGMCKNWTLGPSL